MTNGNIIARIFNSVYACWSPIFHNFIDAQLTRTHARLHVQIHAVSMASFVLSFRSSKQRFTSFSRELI